MMWISVSAWVKRENSSMEIMAHSRDRNNNLKEYVGGVDSTFTNMFMS